MDGEGREERRRERRTATKQIIAATDRRGR
jgi:hypothetical protein